MTVTASNSGANLYATATCAVDDVAIGGGVSHDGGNNWVLNASYPAGAGTNPTGWNGGIHRTGSGNADITVYALCVTPAS